MTQQTDADSMMSEIDNFENEIQTRREREQERHERKMEEISETESEWAEEIREEAGIDALISEWEAILDAREDVRTLERTLKKLPKRALNQIHSGGFNEEITVRDGNVRKYNRKKRANIDAERLVSTYRRNTVDKLIDAKLTGVDATSFKLAFDRLKEAEEFGKKSWTRELDVEDDEFRDETELKVYIRKGKSYKHENQYISLSRGFSSGDRFEPTTENPEYLKVLVHYRGELLTTLQDIRTDVENLRDTYKTTFMQAKRDLPVEVDVEVDLSDDEE